MGIIFYEFAQYVFLRFLKFKLDDVMAAIIAVFGSGTLTVAILLRFSSNFMTSWRPLLLFSVPALSRSQFCSDFLQILGRVSKSQPTVCYLKSAKSVDNFGSYG